jgi:D-aminoacyl-tRNA deacylase
MRALVQRVARARVTVDGDEVGAIGSGLLVLLGVAGTDAEADAERLAERTARLRVFPDQAGRLDRSVLDTGGGVLAVSQFTLVADTSRGHRPSFTPAAEPPLAETMYGRYVEALRRAGVADVATGRFGAQMAVELVNDGPVTILLEAPPRAG